MFLDHKKLIVVQIRDSIYLESNGVQLFEATAENVVNNVFEKLLIVFPENEPSNTSLTLNVTGKNNGLIPIVTIKDTQVRADYDS